MTGEMGMAAAVSFFVEKRDGPGAVPSFAKQMNEGVAVMREEMGIG